MPLQGMRKVPHTNVRSIDNEKSKLALLINKSVRINCSRLTQHTLNVEAMGINISSDY